MHHSDTTVDDPLRHGYHPIRRVTAGEAPWAGLLTRTSDDESCVLVDAEALGPEWPGWLAEPGGHVVGPIGVVRRRDGHDAAVPAMVERLGAFLTRRSGRNALTDGEVVTLAVSVLRGVAEIERIARDAQGEWWLTDAGRPVLAVLGDSRGPTARELLAELHGSASRALDAPLDEATRAAADPRVVVRDLAALEMALFGAAEPRPLSLHSTTPHSPTRRAPRAIEREQPPTPGVEPRMAGWLDAVARHVDADLAGTVSDAVARVRRRLRRRGGGRGRPWLVGAGIAGAILAVGMLWPAGGGTATAGEPGTPGTPATPSASHTDQPLASGIPSASGPSEVTATAAPTLADEQALDWAAVTSDLLTRRTACGDDAACAAAVVEDVTHPFPAGVIDDPVSDRTVTLLDEFGGAAVLRVEGQSDARGPQLVVVVRAGDDVLLRDVHDVAEQNDAVDDDSEQSG